MTESVNQIQVTEEQIQEADKLENNPKLILALIDLMFMNADEGKNIPS